MLRKKKKKKQKKTYTLIHAQR